MAETAQRGNPALKKKEQNKNSKWDPKKRYQFKLLKSYDSAKPRDRDTGELADNPYPPIYMISNNGVAYNPGRDEVEAWRYVFGYSSIWTKDQDKPAPSKAQLENPKNFIEFKNGSLFVMGTNTALLDAMSIQDIYDGVENPLDEKTKLYQLVNEEDVRKIVRQTADTAYLAEKAAREATLAEMIPVAMAFGIDVDDPEENEDRIRTDFIMKAKSAPEAFERQFTNPKNKYKYNIVQALRTGAISSEKVPGRIVLVDTGKTYCDIKEGDVAEQVAQMIMANNSEALTLYSQLEKVMEGQS